MLVCNAAQEGDVEFRKANPKSIPSLKTILRKCPLALFKSNCAMLKRALECGISTEINWALGRISLITSVLGDLKKFEPSDLKKRNLSTSAIQSAQFKNTLILEEYQKLLSEQTFPSDELVSRISYHAFPFFKMIGVLLENPESAVSGLKDLICELSTPSSYYFAMRAEPSIRGFCSWALLRYTQILVIFLNLARSGHVSYLSSFANRSIVLVSSLVEKDSRPLLQCWEALGLSPQPLASLSLIVLELVSCTKVYSSLPFISCLTSIILNSSELAWVYAVRCFKPDFIKSNMLSKQQIASMLERSSYIAISSSKNPIERITALFFIQMLLENSANEAGFSEALLSHLFDTTLHLYLCAVVPCVKASQCSHTVPSQSGSIQLSQSQLALKYLSLSYESHKAVNATEKEATISLKSVYSQYLSWLPHNNEPALSITDLIPLIRQVFPNCIQNLKPIFCQWHNCTYSSLFGIDDHFFSTHAGGNRCKWGDCDQEFPSSDDLARHFCSLHSQIQNIQLADVRVKKDNLIPIEVPDVQLELSRQLLRILELFKRFAAHIRPILCTHLETISMLCFVPSFAGEPAEDAFDRVRICTTLLSLY